MVAKESHSSRPRGHRPGLDSGSAEAWPGSPGLASPGPLLHAGSSHLSSSRAAQQVGAGRRDLNCTSLRGGDGTPRAVIGRGEATPSSPTRQLCSQDAPSSGAGHPAGQAGGRARWCTGWAQWARCILRVKLLPGHSTSDGEAGGEGRSGSHAGAVSPLWSTPAAELTPGGVCAWGELSEEEGAAGEHEPDLQPGVPAPGLLGGMAGPGGGVPQPLLPRGLRLLRHSRANWSK